MTLRFGNLIILMACFFIPLKLELINSAYATEQVNSNIIQGKVSNVIDVTSYTYVEVDTGSEKIWAAAPTIVVKIGDVVTFSTEMPMKDFYSDSIKRNFSLIYFVNRLTTDTDQAISSRKLLPHANIKPVRQSLKGINRVKGGKNIAEIHAGKDNLRGKIIRVRGRVTRFAAQVMGKNWLHIQDSSGFDDLTVTTDKVVSVGDVVIVEGKLELDKDYSYGYVYPVIVLDAKVTKE